MTILETEHYDDDDGDDLFPDFYSVRRDDNYDEGYRVYSKIKGCRAYQSEDRVLYQDGDGWKISDLKQRSGDLDCQNFRSMINSSKPSYETTGELPKEESDRNFMLRSTFLSGTEVSTEIKILRKCEETHGFRIFESAETQKAN